MSAARPKHRLEQAGEPSAPAGYKSAPLTMTDYSAVRRLWRRCAGIGLNESDTPAGIAFFLRRNPRLSVLLRDRRGAVVAAVLCGHDGRRGYLHHLAVAPGHRGRGLGRYLVDRCLGRLGRLRIAKCNIFLYANNAAGHAFWRRLEWTARRDLVVLQRPTR